MLEIKDGIIDLEKTAFKNLGDIHRNLPTSRLYEDIVKNKEGYISHLGPVVVRTGHMAERAPDDKFIVLGPDSQGASIVGGAIKELPEENFNKLSIRLLSYIQNKDIYVQDCSIGADQKHMFPVRIVTETAWHSLFARNMFMQIHDKEQLDKFKPEYTIIHIPGFQSIPEIDGTKSSAFIILNLKQKIVFIGGTSYAGELKQAASMVINTLIYPDKVLFLNSSVNMGKEGDVSMFLGRTGNGKTALASDPERTLIGDHEHGWSDDGIFNYGWGCYPKILNITQDIDPVIYECTRKFGTILENPSMNSRSRRVDLSDSNLSENVRAAYPITHVPNIKREGVCGHPKNIFLLTRDTMGVLPPLARLTTEQAVFSFLISYITSLIETQTQSRDVTPVAFSGVDKKSQNLKPYDYAKLFFKQIATHKSQCWFMNTGWVGEPINRGERIDIKLTRALIKAVTSGAMDNIKYEIDPIFLFEMPTECPGVPSEILNPRNSAKDEGEYELRANQLAQGFIKSFSQFEEDMPDSIKEMVANVVLNEDTLDVMENMSFSI